VPAQGVLSIELLYGVCESKMYQYLKADAVQQLYRQHTLRRHDHHKILFCLIVFEEWLRVN